MKNKIACILFAATLLTVSGCSDFLDVNHDPDALSEIPEAKVLLPAAELCIANNLMGWDFGFGAGYWVEYWTQNYSASQFKSLCEYQPTAFATAYTSLTAGALMDLKKISTLTKDKDPGMYFISEALSIFTWQILTDIWGDLPYSEALRGDEGLVHPKFDTGKDIYTDLLTRIDNLLKVDLSDAKIDGTYDFFYAGDMNEWNAFANSLKLKLMLRISETDTYDNAQTLAFVKSATFLTNSAKIDGKIWDNSQEGKRHPMLEFEEGGAGYLSTNVIACKSFLDYLDVNADPRLDKLFVKTGASQLGAFFGDFESTGDADGNGTPDKQEKYSKALFASDIDLIIMSDWEVNFYIAEVYARANDLVNAQAHYEAGVKASLVQQGIEDNTIVETGYAKWTGGTTEECIKQIAMQKWVANCNYQHIESFIERNRTRYPAVNEIDIESNRSNAYTNFPVGDLTISVKGRALLNAQLPASPIYPDAILQRNNNAIAQKKNVAEKVWWNTKAGK